MFTNTIVLEEGTGEGGKERMDGRVGSENDNNNNDDDNGGNNKIDGSM